MRSSHSCLSILTHCRQWREQQAESIRKRDAASAQRRAETVEKAERAIDALRRALPSTALKTEASGPLTDWLLREVSEEDRLTIGAHMASSMKDIDSAWRLRILEPEDVDEIRDLLARVDATRIPRELVNTAKRALDIDEDDGRLQMACYGK